MNNNLRPLVIRRMERADIPAFLDLIKALADYEKLPPPDAGAKERLALDAMANPPRFSVLLAERAGRLIGYAVYFETYSTFLALPTLYLEDIFILEDERRKGVGHDLIKEVAREAVRRGCGRLEWQVLTWNNPAIEFYEQLEATRLAEWQPYRLTADQFQRLAEGN